MTITPTELLLYAGALAVLFLTPGPVWVAVLARTLSGGFNAAWPLALGVVVGDILWPFIAIMGVSWVVSTFAGFMTVMRWVASIMFLIMGILILRNADKEISTDSRLTKPGVWAGFAAGVAVILGNPKAVLFYMGVLPGFFDLTTLTRLDILAIVLASMAVPFIGNLALSLSIDRARKFIASPQALRKINMTAGVLLILVGLVIPFF